MLSSSRMLLTVDECHEFAQLHAEVCERPASDKDLDGELVVAKDKIEV